MHTSIPFYSYIVRCRPLGPKWGPYLVQRNAATRGRFDGKGTDSLWDLLFKHPKRSTVCKLLSQLEVVGGGAKPELPLVELVPSALLRSASGSPCFARRPRSSAAEAGRPRGQAGVRRRRGRLTPRPRIVVGAAPCLTFAQTVRPGPQPVRTKLNWTASSGPRASTLQP